MEAEVEVEGLPLPLRWRPSPPPSSRSGLGRLEISAPGRTDLFADPLGEPAAVGAPRATGRPAAEFMLSAAVTVELAATYDAGALVLWAGERSWAKLALELSPQGVPTIVSVVTSGVSDDCNSFAVQGNQVWLRVSGLGGAFAFHASTDGRVWRLVRYFALEPAAEVEVGFLAQSPAGAGCTATFDEIAYVPERLTDLRGGG